MVDDEDEDEDDEDDDDPLGDGIDSVSWLPSVIGTKGRLSTSSTSSLSVREGAEILPLFPLGGFVYTPNTEHVLNIFEPRYRQMYTDILMNGTKRFVVATSHPTEKGRFAQIGVLFELEDLKEVSEQTADQIKYICNHKVTGRVTIHRILNPEAWETRETYLKIEGTIHDDSKEATTTTKPTDDVYGSVVAAVSSKEERDLKESFGKLVDIQHDLEEDVRFTQAAKKTLAVKEGAGEESLWQTIRLWQSFVDQRLLARQNELQRDFQEKLQNFLKKEKGLKDNELPSAIGFQDLTPELQKEVKELQKRMAVELQPLVLEQSLTMQKILEAKDHKARCRLLKYFMDAETKRLESKKSLKGLFSSSSSTTLAPGTAIPPEEMITDDAVSSPEARPSATFFDDEDAFQ